MEKLRSAIQVNCRECEKKKTIYPERFNKTPNINSWSSWSYHGVCFGCDEELSVYIHSSNGETDISVEGLFDIETKHTDVIIEKIDKKYEYCIFLDIDGVLNNQLFYQRYYDKKITEEQRNDNIDDVAVDNLNTLINGLGGVDNVLVVCSSSWRFNEGNVSDLNPLFKKYGAIWEFTERTPSSEDRISGVEIQRWLNDNCELYFHKTRHEFKNYIIIDDDSDMLYNQRNNFFQTDTYCGLTHNTVHKILYHFGKK